MKKLFPLKDKVLVDVEAILSIEEENMFVSTKEEIRTTDYGYIKSSESQSAKQLRIRIETGREFVLEESWDSFTTRLERWVEFLP